MKSARRRAREYALQGLYQWQVAGNTAPDIRAHLAADPYFAKADAEYFDQLLAGTIAAGEDLKREIEPALDRKVEALSPVERGILLLAAWELKHAPEVPYRVVINEAIELAKEYGGTDGYKYVNGVLDKLAPRLRPNERQKT
ncbi:MAG TPA: transcription antitermination factor NusB [Burkholderiales bacterium]|nr:transcription antitermination factor NusB [Burkholderiales bacterium]